MSSSGVVRAHVWLSALISLAGCAGPAGASTIDAAPPGHDAARPRVEIGTRESGAIFTPWHDGDAIPLVRGPQGGVMIVPAVAIDGALAPGVDPSFDVTLWNFTLPDRAPLGEFPGVGPLHALFARLDARLVDGPIFDQLGWNEMPGQRLLIRARVTGDGVDALGEVEIVTAPSGAAFVDAGGLDGADAGP